VEELISIGRFARLAGLSVGALRHYDEVDLLRPARVDPVTGYRSYRLDQLEAARLIVRLRELETPVETIRAYLAADDPAERHALLDRHLRRIDARTTRLQRILHQLNQMTTEGTATMTTALPAELDPATERAIAADLFNHTWTLLEQPDRTPQQEDEMVHAAHASRHHWGRVGDAGNWTVGEWQIARVYSVLGRAEPALHHARRALDLCEAHDLGDFHLASACEGLARAHLVAGDLAQVARWKAKATAALAGIADADDREIVENDLATLP
jgi:DNA-binding transcriptional MerR regulator